jgi:hypothetical protein
MSGCLDHEITRRGLELESLLTEQLPDDRFTRSVQNHI